MFSSIETIHLFSTKVTYKPSQLIWNKGAKKAINYLNKLNYLVIVVTNQSGVARGYYSEKDVVKFHDFMNLELYKINLALMIFLLSIPRRWKNKKI